MSMKEADAQKKRILMANPKEELDYIVPGSVEGNCHRCGQAVCLAPSSQAFLQENPGIEVCCFGCLTPVQRAIFESGRAIIEIMKGQDEEIKHYREGGKNEDRS